MRPKPLYPKRHPLLVCGVRPDQEKEDHFLHKRRTKMHLRKLFLVVIAVAAVTFSTGLRGQGPIDGIKVTLPQPVTVGDKVLDPGEYEIRRPSSANRDILQIYNKDKMVYETNVLTVPTGPDNKDPKETKVVLHHIGDAYYFDKIWME